MNRKLGLSLLLGMSLALGSLQADVIKLERSKELKSVQAKVDSNTYDTVQAKKKALLQEALESLKNTNLALKSLDENKTKAAIDILAKVTGKLDMIVARDPSLELLPVAITQKEFDVIVSKELVKSILFDANKALKNGEVQKARHLLKNLASEIVITTTSIPLATYPASIKVIAPMLDEGKIEEAKTLLKATLSSLVVSEEIIPLPILRATLLLKEAEKLTSNEKRDEKENKKLSSLLEEASYQLEMAELLGYGTQRAYQSIYDQIDIIKEKSSGSKSGKGWFEKIKEKITNLKK